MIDRSHSMRHSLPERLGVTRLTGVWQAIEQAGSKLLQQEKVFLIPFNKEINTRVQFRDKAEIAGLKMKYPPYGNTRLWDCIMAGLETVYEPEIRLVVYTDGDDCGSSHSYEDVRREARVRQVFLEIIVVTHDVETDIPEARYATVSEEICRMLTVPSPIDGSTGDTRPAAIYPPVFNFDPLADDRDVQWVTGAVRNHLRFLENLTGLSYCPVPTCLVEHAAIRKHDPIPPLPTPPRINPADLWEFARFLWGVCMFVHQPSRLAAITSDGIDKTPPESFIQPERNDETSFFKGFGTIPDSVRHTILWGFSEGCFALITRLIQYGLDADLPSYTSEYTRESISNQIDRWQRDMYLPGYSTLISLEATSEKMFMDMIRTLEDVVERMPVPFEASNQRDFLGPYGLLDRLHPRGHWDIAGPNLEIWKKHLSNADFQTILNTIKGNRGKWNFALSSIVKVLPIAVETLFRLMGQFQKSLSPTFHVSRKLNAWGMYVPDAVQNPDIAAQLHASECGVVLLSLSQMRKDCKDWLGNREPADHQALVEMLAVHEHAHAIVHQGLEKDGSRPWDLQYDIKDRDSYHAVSEALAEWATLERFRKNRALSILIREHIEADRLPQWPYNAAASIENSPLARQKFKAVMGYFQKSLPVALGELLGSRPAGQATVP